MTESSVLIAKSLPPVHPGEVLLEEFLKPLGISQNRLARDLVVPAQRINDIVRKNRAVTVDTALRLARYFPHDPPILAQPPDALRPGNGPGNPPGEPGQPGCPGKRGPGGAVCLGETQLCG
jgi:addiction module HigA family antidote